MIGKLRTFWKAVWQCIKRCTILDLLTGIYMDQERLRAKVLLTVVMCIENKKQSKCFSLRGVVALWKSMDSLK